MLKFYNYDIVCQEIPDQVTLAINISGCPNHCPGCHSPWLWEDVGDVLCAVPAEGGPADMAALEQIVGNYAACISCVCFMGGDNSPEEVQACALRVRELWPSLRTAWYSGRDVLPQGVDAGSFDYIKLGPYIEACGGLRSPSTNQKLYRIADGRFEEIHVRDPRL